ncbi:hypothetical protein, partial [Burkholderia gladioli]|uniref:hypothetical protein n=1 Tax=Burkholderia gladioli TaxID=28095 RepID=UPI003F796CFB
KFSIGYLLNNYPISPQGIPLLTSRHVGSFAGYRPRYSTTSPPKPTRHVTLISNRVPFLAA